MATGANGIKAELPPPTIKMDPANASPNPLADAEAFEDDTDLQMPDPNNQGAWLVRVPKYLYEAWAKLSEREDMDDDTELELGNVRVYGQPGDAHHKIELRLHESPLHQEVPKNYNLKVSDATNSNVVVFSEKDLPGHKSQQFGRNRLQRPSGIPAKSERYGQNAKKTGYRSAIPKQTALAPPIKQEAVATAIEDKEYDELMAKRYLSAMQPKAKTTITTGIDRQMHPGQNTGTFSSFVPGQNRVKGKKRPPKEKAVRVSQTELLDLLYQCFKEYKYWQLKALRQRLNQPETYIRQTLEQIATLIRAGDFATTWMLKPEYAAMQNIKDEQVKDEAVKAEPGEDTDMGTGDEMGEGDDDDELEFEDA